jgi:hypothetical protein
MDAFHLAFTTAELVEACVLARIHRAGISVAAVLGTVTIRAALRNLGVLATRCSHTVIDCTHIEIVAVERLKTALARTVVAMIVECARAPIVAGKRIVGVDAACGGRAYFGRAGVAIVARRRGAAHAEPTRAGIRSRARVSIVTTDGVVVEMAAIRRGAAVGGAEESVCANQRRAAYARAVIACVHGRARVSIAAWRGVVRVGAPTDRIAGVVGTGVPIIAYQSGAAGAGPRHADVASGTGVTVRAQIAGELSVFAPDPGGAGVDGA